MGKKEKDCEVLLKAVVVIWEDSCSPYCSTDQMSMEDAGNLELMEIFEVGWYLNETDKAITICGFISEDSQARHIRVIPKSCVKKIKRLK